VVVDEKHLAIKDRPAIMKLFTSEHVVFTLLFHDLSTKLDLESHSGVSGFKTVAVLH
jgi:hypothetical protein